MGGEGGVVKGCVHLAYLGCLALVVKVGVEKYMHWVEGQDGLEIVK